MKAAVFQGVGKPLVVENVSDPKPRPTDVIIKTHRCGVCGTDLHMTSEHFWGIPAGTILGHEYAGEIVEVGAEVSGLRKGDVITAIPSAGCGHCRACCQDNPTLCTNLEGGMGGFGEYMRIPARAAVRLPRSYTPGDAALVEPFTVGLRGIRMAGIKPGDRVLVLGAGSVGLTSIFWAKRLGASRVVATSRSSRRADMVMAMGADKFVPSGPTDVQDITEALGGPPEIVFECIGAPGALSRAVELVGKFGQVISMGTCTAPDTFIPALAAMKAVRMQFPVGYSLRDFEYVADQMLSGKIDPKIMITSVVSLSDLPKTIEALRNPNNETKVQVSYTM